MHISVEIKKKLEKVFDKKQATVLTEVISDAYSELVKTSDFNELKGIVKELAEAQKRTEIKVAELSDTVTKLSGTVAGLSDTVTKLSDTVAEISEDMKILAKGLDNTRGEIGGLSRSMSYAFENEAYRMLPGVLKDKYGIQIKEKIIRADMGGKEINFFGYAVSDGREAIIVGEARLRLDERRQKEKENEGDVFKELEGKVDAVRAEYADKEIIKILVTHYATKGFLREAKEKDIIVVQSFEWI